MIVLYWELCSFNRWSVGSSHTPGIAFRHLPPFLSLSLSNIRWGWGLIICVSLCLWVCWSGMGGVKVFRAIANSSVSETEYAAIVCAMSFEYHRASIRY